MNMKKKLENLHVCSVPNCNDPADAIGRDGSVFCQFHYDKQLDEAIGYKHRERTASRSGEAECIVIKGQDTVCIVPMDDCMIQVVWSQEHERLVAVIREIPQKE